jgi:hypothetical protein
MTHEISPEVREAKALAMQMFTHLLVRVDTARAQQAREDAAGLSVGKYPSLLVGWTVECEQDVERFVRAIEAAQDARRVQMTDEQTVEAAAIEAFCFYHEYSEARDGRKQLLWEERKGTMQADWRNLIRAALPLLTAKLRAEVDSLEKVWKAAEVHNARLEAENARLREESHQNLTAMGAEVMRLTDRVARLTEALQEIAERIRQGDRGDGNANHPWFERLVAEIDAALSEEGK